MNNTNGTVTYEMCLGRNAYRIKTIRGRITAKRVETYSRVWDHSGKRITAYRPGMIWLQLLSFQRDGGPLVVVSAPHANTAEADAPNQITVATPPILP